MNLKDVETLNAAALRAVREAPGRVHASEFPFYGYYEVDLFECPPFIMFTNNDCPRAGDILFGRHFEPQSMKLWCRLARTATGFLDIGAHVGVYSLAAASLRPDLPIHAFEPNPHAHARLRIHKAINGFTNIVEHPVAVGSQNTMVRFSWAKKAAQTIPSGGSIATKIYLNRENTVVVMEKLDGTELVSTLGAQALVKIDVEGSEIQTLEGMREVIALKPDILLETFSKAACDAYNAALLPLGYDVYFVREGEQRLERRDQLEPAVPSSADFNQFLTVRNAAEIADLTK